MSFYVQAQKIVLSVYQLYLNQSQKQDISNRYQVMKTAYKVTSVIFTCKETALCFFVSNSAHVLDFLAVLSLGYKFDTNCVDLVRMLTIECPPC